MPELRLSGRPSRAKVALAFAAVYLIWGSTYLAIRFAIETLPPFLMAGVRFLLAGSILYGWAWARGAGRPAAAHWVGALTIGGLLLLGGNGAVVWAEQRVPSGLTALLVAIVPLWMVLLDWARPGGERPGPMLMGGIVVGLGGLALLVGPSAVLGGGQVDPVGAGVLVLGSLSWATGSLYARRAPLPASPLQATAMEMLAGGALLLVAGLLAGETARFDPGAVSTRSVVALLYLVVFGALIGYTAYIWLLGVTTPARVSTYAYVNPVVAVILGWAVAGEPLTPRMIVAAAVIVGAVAMITVRRARRGRPAMERPETACAGPRDAADTAAAPTSPPAAPIADDPLGPRPRRAAAGEG